MQSIAANLRALPSVSLLLECAQALIQQEGHERTTRLLRRALDTARTSVKAGAPAPTIEQLLDIALAMSYAEHSAMFSPIAINATGVIIHTNLGRAPLSIQAQRAILSAMNDYSPLEFDLQSGERGKRGEFAQNLLCEVTGAEAAMVVNNCALATVLMLSTFAKNKGVVIARGQLVEIGGGFRVPEIMTQSGAQLIEIGTTNKVKSTDYETAISQPPDHISAVAAILRVHPSNFKMIGFTQDVGVAELVKIANKLSPPIAVLDDLGSGALLDTSQFGLAHEPQVQESVKAGVAVTAFSGDKLMGGPQAGILVGKKDAIERCRTHPMARAFRTDKLTLAGLCATLTAYARGTAQNEIPVIRMLALKQSEIAARAQVVLTAISSWCAANGIAADLQLGESTVGGGSMPGESLPTTLITLTSHQSNFLAQQLRLRSKPIITRTQNDKVLLDLRTVLDDEALVESMIDD